MVEPDGATPRKKTDLPPVHESLLPREHGLYRPRHSPRQRTSQGLAVVFFFVPLLLLVLGVRPPAFENRPLADFPSPGDGWGFVTGFDRWATDHLPLRDRAVAAAGGISRGVFGESPQYGQRGTGNPVVPAPEEPSASEEDRDRLRGSAFPKVIEGRDDWLYVGYDVLGACLPERSLNEVISSLSRLRDVVEASGREFVLVVAPDKTTAVPEFLPETYPGEVCSQTAHEEFWRRVGAEAGAIDLRPALRDTVTGSSAAFYSKIDSHWNQEGAIAMTRAVAERVQPGVTAAWKTSPAVVVEREGDLPTLLGRTAVLSVQTYDLAPDGSTVRSRPVDKEFREPLVLTQPGGPGVVGARVGMLADSFTLSATSYLAGGFADITVVHSDTAGGDSRSVARMLADKDVVVLEAAERTLVGGINPVLSGDVVDAIGDELAKNPR